MKSKEVEFEYDEEYDDEHDEAVARGSPVLASYKKSPPKQETKADTIVPLTNIASEKRSSI